MSFRKNKNLYADDEYDFEDRITRRDRIKKSRAKRNVRRFYEADPCKNKLRARGGNSKPKGFKHRENN
jgi:hypothetical protein